jgi:hypothetical protein
VIEVRSVEVNLQFKCDREIFGPAVWLAPVVSSVPADRHEGWLSKKGKCGGIGQRPPPSGERIKPNDGTAVQTKKYPQGTTNLFFLHRHPPTAESIIMAPANTGAKKQKKKVSMLRHFCLGSATPI